LEDLEGLLQGKGKMKGGKERRGRVGEGEE